MEEEQLLSLVNFVYKDLRSLLGWFLIFLLPCAVFSSSMETKALFTFFFIIFLIFFLFVVLDEKVIKKALRIKIERYLGN